MSPKSIMPVADPTPVPPKESYVVGDLVFKWASWEKAVVSYKVISVVEGHAVVRGPFGKVELLNDLGRVARTALEAVEHAADTEDERAKDHEAIAKSLRSSAATKRRRAHKLKVLSESDSQEKIS